MTRRRSVWLAVAASTLAHGAFAWQLARAPRRGPARPARDTFEVRMVSLPPPPSNPPPEPPAAKPPLPKPKAKLQPTPPKPLPEPPRPTAEPAPVAPESSTAAPALLAESGSAPGAIVQLAGAPIGALATTALSAPRAPAASPRSWAPLSKLSDLSRKPRAPSLDAALRDNYPAELRRRGTEGQAEVRVVIDSRGRVGDIAVVSETAQGFAEACRRTLLGSRWSEPIDRDGQPVSTRLTYRCRFQIER